MLGPVVFFWAARSNRFPNYQTEKKGPPRTGGYFYFFWGPENKGKRQKKRSPVFKKKIGSQTAPPASFFFARIFLTFAPTSSFFTDPPSPPWNSLDRLQGIRPLQTQVPPPPLQKRKNRFFVEKLTWENGSPPERKEPFYPGFLTPPIFVN